MMKLLLTNETHIAHGGFDGVGRRALDNILAQDVPALDRELQASGLPLINTITRSGKCRPRWGEGAHRLEFATASRLDEFISLGGPFVLD